MAVTAGEPNPTTDFWCDKSRKPVYILRRSEPTAITSGRLAMQARPARFWSDGNCGRTRSHQGLLSPRWRWLVAMAEGLRSAVAHKASVISPPTRPLHAIQITASTKPAIPTNQVPRQPDTPGFSSARTTQLVGLYWIPPPTYRCLPVKTACLSRCPHVSFSLKPALKKDL